MENRLEFLLALARERHFGRAADSCGVSQQTLSASIKQLERQFGVLLVRRGARFQGLTVEGERVLHWARRIVGDIKDMHRDVAVLKGGLTGHLRIAAIPTALPMVAGLTTPFHAAHPDVRFSIESTTSSEILALLEDAGIDAGLTYLENEPVGRVMSIPLYRERYMLLTAADGALGAHKTATWAEVGRIPLCLLTPNMQNRRIIDHQLRSAGAEPAPTLESNSMIVLMSHVRTGKWSSVMPAVLAQTLGLTAMVRAIPIVEPVVAHTIGLVVPQRDQTTGLVAALVRIARNAAADWAKAGA